MIPWSPSQSEPDRLRSCIEGLAHDELAHRVDVFKLSEHNRLTILSQLDHPEKYLHRSIVRFIHDKYNPVTLEDGSHGIPNDSIINVELHKDFQQRLEVLAKLPGGFIYAIDLILQHVWLYATGSTNYLIRNSNPKVQSTTLVLQEIWDEFALVLARNLFLLTHASPGSFSEPRPPPSLPTTQYIIEVAAALRVPCPKSFHSRYLLPRTTTFLLDTARRAINQFLVTRTVGPILPVELAEYVYNDLLELKGIPTAGPHDAYAPDLHADFNCLQSEWRENNQLGRASSTETIETCDDRTCCCRHEHKLNLTIRRWDAAKRSYVPAHNRDFAGTWTKCGLEAFDNRSRWTGCCGGYWPEPAFPSFQIPPPPPLPVLPPPNYATLFSLPPFDVTSALDTQMSQQSCSSATQEVHAALHTPRALPHTEPFLREADM